MSPPTRTERPKGREQAITLKATGKVRSQFGNALIDKDEVLETGCGLRKLNPKNLAIISIVIFGGKQNNQNSIKLMRAVCCMKQDDTDVLTEPI